MISGVARREVKSSYRVMRPFPILVAFVAATLAPPSACAQSLRGSPVSLARQRNVAEKHDFTFLRTGSEVQRFVSLGLLVPVTGGPGYELSGVSFPYARPQVKLFIERLSSQYHAACGERLVVTSLTRPLNRQPSNASSESVHPTGLAMDLRVSNKAKCRTWLETTLMSLERRDLAEATRERRPPHYHVVVFPTAYEKFVTTVTGTRTVVTTDAEAEAAAEAGGPQVSDATATDQQTAEYRVSRGDSLWLIARKFGTDVEQLKELNGLTGNRILPGQTLRVPGERSGR